MWQFLSREPVIIRLVFGMKETQRMSLSWALIIDWICQLFVDEFLELFDLEVDMFFGGFGL